MTGNRLIHVGFGNIVNAEKIIARVEQDDMFMEYMSGEKQVIMTGVIHDRCDSGKV